MQERKDNRLSDDLDWGKTAQNYNKWRKDYPASFYAYLDDQKVAQSGDEALDLGTGTGLFARGLARRGCRVTGIDISDELLQVAVQQASADDLDISFAKHPAEETGQDSESFDFISAAMCWHWFDRKKTIAEVRRVLRPGGHLMIVHYDYHMRPGNIVEKTMGLLNQANPIPKGKKWTFQYPDWLYELTDNGLGEYKIFGTSCYIPYSMDQWVGRILANAQTGASMSDAEMTAFRENFIRELAPMFDGKIQPIEHRIFSVLIRKDE